MRQITLLIVSVWLLCVGVALEVFGVVVTVRCVVRNGPSGIPFLPVILYLVGLAMLHLAIGLSWQIVWRVFKCLLLLHCFLYFLLPIALRAAITLRRRRSRE